MNTVHTQREGELGERREREREREREFKERDGIMQTLVTRYIIISIAIVASTYIASMNLVIVLGMIHNEAYPVLY